MSWTSPSTFVAGTVFTAAAANTHMRDNPNALRSGGIAIASQAAGDFGYPSSATQWARIAGVSGKWPVSDGAGSWAMQTLADSYTLIGSITNLNPADGTTYYGGQPITPDATTTAANRKMFAAKAGTITAAYLSIVVMGTLATSETSTLSIRLNNTTDTTVSSSVAADAAYQTYSVTGLSIAIAAGGYIEMKWVTPTWATNPTGVHAALVVLVSVAAA